MKSLKKRIELVKAMETVVRAVNDEEVLDYWLSYGVADGDITENTSDGELVYYVENDEVFAELMTEFLGCMEMAYENGGLYCDDVVSKQ